MIYSRSFPNVSGAGAQVSLPAMLRPWRLLSVFGYYQPGAVVGQRAFELAIHDGADQRIAVFPITQTLDTGDPVATGITWAVGLQNAKGSYYITAPLPPDLWIEPQWSVRLSTQGLDAADLFYGGIYRYEQPKEKPWWKREIEK